MRVHNLIQRATREALAIEAEAVIDGYDAEIVRPAPALPRRRRAGPASAPKFGFDAVQEARFARQDLDGALEQQRLGRTVRRL